MPPNRGRVGVVHLSLVTFPTFALEVFLKMSLFPVFSPRQQTPVCFYFPKGLACDFDSVYFLCMFFSFIPLILLQLTGENVSPDSCASPFVDVSKENHCGP